MTSEDQESRARQQERAVPLVVARAAVRAVVRDVVREDMLNGECPGSEV